MSRSLRLSRRRFEHVNRKQNRTVQLHLVDRRRYQKHQGSRSLKTVTRTIEKATVQTNSSLGQRNESDNGTAS